MSSFVPKYIVKRILPMDALSNVDVSGDGTADHVQFVAYNVMLPISVSEMSAWGLDLEKAGTLYIDGEELDPAKVLAYYDGQKYSLATFYENVDLVIPIGGRAKILYPWPGGLSLGEHTLRCAYEWDQFVGDITVTREITENRACVPFSPGFE